MYNQYDPEGEGAYTSTEVSLPPLTVPLRNPAHIEWLNKFGVSDAHQEHYFMDTYGFNEPRLVSLITNAFGDLIFWQARDVITNNNPKYINQLGLRKPDEAFIRYNLFPSYLFIVEDLVSALRIHDLGYNVYAILGNRPNKQQIDYLRRLVDLERIFLWLDPDEGGLEGVKYVKKKLMSHYEVLWLSGLQEPKYLDDETLRETLDTWVNY